MRITKSVQRHKRRKKILALAKGFRATHKNCFSIAVDKVNKKLVYQYRDRRNIKRDMRRLWITRINAGLRMLGTTYSKFFAKLKDSAVNLNRKSLSELASRDMDSFTNVVNQVMISNSSTNTI